MLTLERRRLLTATVKDGGIKEGNNTVVFHVKGTLKRPLLKAAAVEADVDGNTIEVNFKRLLQ